jgi:hypothetical protein
MRLRWWQYVVGFLVAVLSIAAIVGCGIGLVFAARALSPWLTPTGVTAIIVDSFIKAATYLGLAIFVLVAALALVGMGIDIAESWLWPAQKGTRKRP